MNIFKKILYSISWIPAIIFHVVAIVLGLVIVPIALLCREWPKIFWLWNNDEEGCPEWWLIHATQENWFIEKFPRFWWFAIRNPVNNFRFIFEDREPTIDSNWDSDIMEAGEMLKVGQVMAYRWAYAGPFAGYRRVWLNSLYEYSEIWIAWKVGSVVPGMGFTMQFRHNRKIGT